MSRFTEAVDIAIDHWNQGEGRTNSYKLDSLEIDPEEFGDVVARVLLQLLLNEAMNDMAIYGYEAFLFGLLVGQKMEALRAEVPDHA